MRPILVEFQAFGPYAGYEKVDFEKLASKGLFLICGKTGIGKTMVLDAITFALFGRSSGHGRDDFEAMRCTKAPFDTTTFVLFEFENKGNFYRFERRLERKRKNLSASYNLMCKGEDGVWRTMLENPREKELNAKAAEIIGLDYDQFRQVIILPQGQFEKLLTSSSEEKEKILSSIFGEEKWQRIAEKFLSETESRKNELKGIKERIQRSLEEEQCESILQLQELINNKNGEIASLKADFEKQDYDRVIKEQQDLLALAKRFNELHKAEDKVNQLVSQSNKREEWQLRSDQAKRAESVRALIDNAHTAQQNFKNREEALVAAQKNVDVKTKQAAEAFEKLQVHLAKEDAIKEQGNLRIRYENSREEYLGLDKLTEEVKEKQNSFIAAQEETTRAKAWETDCANKVVKLNLEYIALRDEHDGLFQAYLASITGDLASGLQDGEPCPVCGSRVHPCKATMAENAVTKSEVDQKKRVTDKKYTELQRQTDVAKTAKDNCEKKRAEETEKERSYIEAKTKLDGMKGKLIPGITSVHALEAEINRLKQEEKAFYEGKDSLEKKERELRDAQKGTEAALKMAEEERTKAMEEKQNAQNALMEGLMQNQIPSEKEAVEMMMSQEERELLSKQIIQYDTDLENAKKEARSIAKDLEGKNEPDSDECEGKINWATNAKTEYEKAKAVAETEVRRLEKKANSLKEEGEGIEDKIHEAESDYAFAKKLRGDTGTGLQRYVLGVMFSSVIVAANKMLEKVHGGRYRLFRSDDRMMGSNKRGLELKVYDKNSGEHEGRFVNTLSGGEKFLVSLALSIGMSTIAQKSGIRIEALFIDEGFGSLDEDSIDDAMDVLNSIREASGIVGIISHVKILQEQIPTKLRVFENDSGSHISSSIG